MTWSNITYDKQLIGPVCQASLASFTVAATAPSSLGVGDIGYTKGDRRGALAPRPAATARRLLFFSNQHSTSSRSHLTVQRSEDGGVTWDPETLLIQEKSSAGYSSLVQGSVGDEKHSGVLFESDSGCIDFATFPIDFNN
jgi:hypothetical protein